MIYTSNLPWNIIYIKPISSKCLAHLLSFSYSTTIVVMILSFYIRIMLILKALQFINTQNSKVAKAVISMKLLLSADVIHPIYLP